MSPTHCRPCLCCPWRHLAELHLKPALEQICYKLALKPLGNYIFFLASAQTYSYVLVSFILHLPARCQG